MAVRHALEYRNSMPQIDESAGGRLLSSIIGLQQRREDRARAEKEAALQEELQRRDQQIAEETHAAKMAEIARTTAALTERAQEPIKFEDRARAGQDAAMIPDTPEERAVWAEKPMMGDTPTPQLPLTVAGQTINIPLLDRSETLARGDEDFERTLRQAGQLAQARRVTVPANERVAQILGVAPGTEVPEDTITAIAGRLAGAEAKPTDLFANIQTVSGGYLTAGPDGKHAFTRTAAEPSTGPSDRHTDSMLMQVTNRFEGDAIMKQAIQGRTISSIADQVIADPTKASNQLKALYVLVKNLDPESAVREGEVTLARMAESYREKFGRILESAYKGQVIHPQVAADLAQATKELSSAWQANAATREKQYRAKAGILGVGPQFEQYLSGFSFAPQAEWEEVAPGVKKKKR